MHELNKVLDEILIHTNLNWLPSPSDQFMIMKNVINNLSACII